MAWLNEYAKRFRDKIIDRLLSKDCVKIIYREEDIDTFYEAQFTDGSIIQIKFIPKKEKRQPLETRQAVIDHIVNYPGMSQVEIARRLGISQGTVSRIYIQEHKHICQLKKEKEDMINANRANNNTNAPTAKRKIVFKTRSR